MSRLMEALLERRPASRIYHYTSQRGLIGIVTSRSIWATSIYHLNDATEFDYARRIASRMIDEKPDAGAGGALKEALTRSLDSYSRVNLFVACFSEKSDLLSQWRAYCPNANGYSIGFTYEELSSQMQAQRFFLAPCVYESVAQEELIREIIDEPFQNPSEIEDSEISAVCYRCVSKFHVIGCVVKDPSFAEEAEWRLVSQYPQFTGDPRIKVREGKSMLLPYFEFRLVPQNELFPKIHVVVGPTPHMELSTRSLGFLFGKSDVSVTPTKIPYRGW